MIKVPPLSMQEIDRWPIGRAGVPHRLARVMEESGMHTVGDLRRMPPEALRKRPGAGPKSVVHARAFLERCEDMAAGRMAFRDFTDALAALLTERPRWVLGRRYGLYRPDAVAARDYCTLQEMANEDGLTRERVRQMERQALDTLSSRFAAHALSPFRTAVRRAVESLGAADAVVLCDVPPDGFERCNPASAALLLADIRPAEYSFREGLFSVWDADTLQAVGTRLKDELQSAGEPRAIRTLSASCRIPETALRALLRNIPGVLTDREGRAFLSETAAARWIADRMQRLDRPAHYRDIARALNGCLEPCSQKGVRYFLDKLSANPIFIRTQHGMYDLA